jgi:hypothetical protein
MVKKKGKTKNEKEEKKLAAGVRKRKNCGCMGGNPFAPNTTTNAVARATFYCHFE